MTEEQKARNRANLAKARAARGRKKEAAPETPPSEEQFPPPAPAEGGEYVGPAVEESAEAEPEVELTPFQRFVLSLDADTRELLSEDDLVTIWAEQQAKAKAEKRAAAKKAVTEKALSAARIAEGVISPASADELERQRRMAEPVEFTVYMPILGGIADQGVNVGPIDIGLRWDGRIYLDGHRYTLPRAQYESMRHALYLAQQNELAFEGKGLLRRLQLSRMSLMGETLQ